MKDRAARGGSTTGLSGKCQALRRGSHGFGTPAAHRSAAASAGGRCSTAASIRAAGGPRGGSTNPASTRRLACRPPVGRVDRHLDFERRGRIPDLAHLAVGADEVNPIMAVLVYGNVAVFAALKMAMTGASVVLMVFLARYRFMRVGRVDVRAVRDVDGLSWLIGYEMWMLQSVGRSADLVNLPDCVTFHIVPPWAKLWRQFACTFTSHHIDVLEVFPVRSAHERITCRPISHHGSVRRKRRFHRRSLRTVPEGSERRRPGLGQLLQGLAGQRRRDSPMGRFASACWRALQQPLHRHGASRRRLGRGQRQAGRGVAPDPGVCESRPPDCESGPPGAAGARQAVCAGPAIFRAVGRGPRDRILHRQPQSTPSRSARRSRTFSRDLKFIYTDTIGAEFAHVSDTDERLWLQDNFQSARMQHRFSAAEKKNILWQLTAAEGLERYLHTKYVGQKRFSLEGGDSLIPLLDDLVQHGGAVPASKRPSSAWRIAAGSTCW